MMNQPTSSTKLPPFDVLRTPQKIVGSNEIVKFHAPLIDLIKENLLVLKSSRVTSVDGTLNIILVY